MVIAEYLERKYYGPRRRRIEAEEAEARKKARQALRDEVREEIHEEMREEARESGRARGRADAYAKALADAYEEGRADARREFTHKIRDWNQRRLEAQIIGEPFDEPPPMDDD